MKTNPNDLAHWYPIIKDVVPTPRTIILEMPEEAQLAIFRQLWGEEAESPTAFFDAVRAAGDEIGWPCFLRSGHTSGKHGWDNTCSLDSPDKVARCVGGIVEYSEMAGLMGLPYGTWAVRELLPTLPYGACARYGNMPICKEFRFFVDDGNVRCWHPYWPLFSLEEGEAVYIDDDFSYEEFCTADDEAELKRIASAAGAAIGGSWSIDVLETEKGWFVTDMALAEESFHWDGCLTADGPAK